MELARDEYRKDEKIDGVIYDMSPSPDFRHAIVDSNIHTIVKNGLENSLCLVFMENLDYMYHPEENDDYFVPDVMVVCDRKGLKGGTYRGVPKFIVETLSPSTARKDKTVKKDAYEKAGVSEYWIVSPQGKSVEIYYLVDGVYSLEYSYILQDDPEVRDYNAETVICLREFPHIRMELQDIFKGVG